VSFSTFFPGLTPDQQKSLHRNLVRINNFFLIGTTFIAVYGIVLVKDKPQPALYTWLSIIWPCFTVFSVIIRESCKNMLDTQLQIDKEAALEKAKSGIATGFKEAVNRWDTFNDKILFIFNTLHNIFSPSSSFSADQKILQKEKIAEAALSAIQLLVGSYFPESDKGNRLTACLVCPRTTNSELVVVTYGRLPGTRSPGKSRLDRNNPRGAARAFREAALEYVDDIQPLRIDRASGFQSFMCWPVLDENSRVVAVVSVDSIVTNAFSDEQTREVTFKLSEPMLKAISLALCDPSVFQTYRT
jgi:hypothetical protein